MLRNSINAILIFTLGIACVGNAAILQDDFNTFGLWHCDSVVTGFSPDDNTIMGTITVSPKRPNAMNVLPAWGNAAVTINGSGKDGGCLEFGTDGRQAVSFTESWPQGGTPTVNTAGSEIKMDGWFFLPNKTCLPIPTTAGGPSGTTIPDQYWFQISTNGSGIKCNLHCVLATPTVGTQKRGEATLYWAKTSNGSTIQLPLYRYVNSTGLPLTDGNALDLTGKWIHIVAMAQYTSPAPAWNANYNRTQLDITDASTATTYTVTGANTNTLVGSGITGYLGQVNGKQTNTPYRGYRGRIDEFKLSMRTHDAMVAYAPTPASPSNVSPTSSLMASWIKATPFNPADTITQNVWVGTTATFDANNGWTKVNPAPITANTYSLGAIGLYETKYWKVDSIDSGTGATTSSAIWNVTGNDIAPTVNVGADVYTYLVGGTRTISMTPTVTDPDSSGLTYSWSQIAGPSAAIASPSSLNTNVTFTQVGIYYLKLVADDGIFTGFDTVKVNVLASACAAAQAAPGYTKNANDFNNDCRVSFPDFATVAANWAKCNSLDPACN